MKERMLEDENNSCYKCLYFTMITMCICFTFDFILIYMISKEDNSNSN